MQHASEFEPHPDNPYSELDNFFAAVYWEAERVKTMTLQTIHSNYYANYHAAITNLKAKGITQSDLNDPDNRPEFSIGKPVPLPKRTLALNEATQEWIYHPKIDVEV